MSVLVTINGVPQKGSLDLVTNEMGNISVVDSKLEPADVAPKPPAPKTDTKQ